MSDLLTNDQLFITKLREIVLANLSNESFDIEKLAGIACVSRSSLHRRLKHLTNLNASHFIREIRLKKSLEMLQNEHSTAAEVGYKVGFGSPAYFTRCFREYYGYPPGEARKRFMYEETGSCMNSYEELKLPTVHMLSRWKLIKIISAVVTVIISMILLFFMAPGNRHLGRREKILGRRVKYLSDVVSNLV